MMIEGSGSIPLTSGSGSERPKNVWIRNTGKKFYISLKIGPNFSIQHSKLKYLNYEN